MRYLFSLLFFCALVLPGLMAQAELRFTDCFLDDCRSFRGDDKVQFAHLKVPEDRSKPEGKWLRLAVVILKSISDEYEEDPIMFLDGGPGGNTLINIHRWTDHYLRENRDLILMDFRALGYSEPELCPNLEMEIWDIISQDLSAEQFKQKKAGLFEDCFGELRGSEIDLTKYNSTAVIEDLEDLRKELGLLNWNLYGISYGTRLAQAYMKNHPEGIRSVVLDSPVPVNFPLLGSYLSSYRSGLETFFNMCRESDVCSERFPHLEDLFYRTMEEIKEQPLVISFPQSPDSRLVINSHEAHLSFHQLLYLRDFYPTIPWLIRALEKRDKTVFENLSRGLFQRSQLISQSVYIIKSFYDYGLLLNFDTLAEDDLLKNALTYFDADEKIYQNIDFIIPDSAQITTFESDLPTLILTGSNDPITPSDFGRRVKEYLHQAYWLDFPGVGHAVSLGPDCARNITAEFLNNPTSAPDDSCIDGLRENPVEWLPSIYYNPMIGRFGLLIVEDRNPFIISGLGAMVLFFLISLLWGAVSRFKNAGEIPPFIWRRNIYFRLTAFLSLVFFALLFWYFYKTAENHSILVLIGLMNEARWIFFLVYFILLGMAFSLIWYMQSYFESTAAGRVFYGLMMLVFLWVSSLLLLFKMVP